MKAPGRPAGLALALLAGLLTLALPAAAKTFRWSSQGDFLTADPHAQNEGINNLLLYHVYERLAARDPTGTRFIPALALSWEQVNPLLWRFRLRPGVKFHDGTPFTADDVVFSVERAQSPTSNFRTYAGRIGKPRKVDDLTVEFATTVPTPILVDYASTVMIMSRAWCLKHGAQRPQDFKNAEDTYGARNANGTGPYRFVSWEAEVKTVLRENPDWWGRRDGRVTGNVDEILYRPIKSDPTRMAALVSGELDFVLDPPLQDLPRLKQNPALKILEGPENRVIFLAMDQSRDEAKHTNAPGKNPFKDLRVRQALAAAIDIEAIKSQVMRGQSAPTGSMVPSPAMSDPSLEPRAVPFDLARSKRLLAEAGYPQGFETQLLCPNNRYVNDERICTAIAAMWAKADVKASLVLKPRAQFFQQVDQLDVAVYLYGWGGANTDPGFTLGPLLHSYDGKAWGDFNSGRIKDPELDRLTEAANVEMDPAKRRALLVSALKLAHDRSYTIPLHRQVVPWAMRAGVKTVHRPDNFLDAYTITVP